VKLPPLRPGQFPGLGATHVFWCPACRHFHWIDGRWTITGSEEAPTVRASVLVNLDGAMRPDGSREVIRRCHLFVTDGRLEYLGDCTHALAGKTVDMIDLDEELEPINLP
jgi:hypothetical protein